MWIKVSDIYNFMSKTQNILLSTSLRKFFSAFPFRCSICRLDLGLIVVPPSQLVAHSYLQYLAIRLMLYSQALFSRDKTSYNLMVRGQNCRLDEAILSTLLLWWPLWCPNLCEAELRRRKAILQTLCCRRNPTKAWIQNS
jgi:hypothetical protein